MCEAGNWQRGRQSGDDGLTIVELLIALIVILIAFSALASTIIAAFGSIRNNEARVRGVALANEAVEEMASIPWDQLGLSEEDTDLKPAIDAALAAGEPLAIDPDTLALDAGGEAVVLLLDDARIPVHRQETTRDNREYVIERWVTWFEEDGQPELKRMIAVVSWTIDGDTVSIRSDGLRAPDVDELFDLEVSVIVTSDAEDPSSAARLIPDPSDAEKIVNRDLFYVTAILGDVPSSVKLQFRDREGVLRTDTAPAILEGGKVTRQWTISERQHQFRHGQNSFTVFATSDDGQVASNTGTLRFYQDLSIQTPEVRQDETTITEVVVDQNQQVCGPPVEVRVSVEGMSPGEASPVAGADPASTGGLAIRGEDLVEDLFLGLVSEENFGGVYNIEIDEFDVEQSIVDVILADDESVPHSLDLRIVAHRLAAPDAFQAGPFAEPVVLSVDVVPSCP